MLEIVIVIGVLAEGGKFPKNFLLNRINNYFIFLYFLYIKIQFSKNLYMLNLHVYYDCTLNCIHFVYKFLPLLCIMRTCRTKEDYKITIERDIDLYLVRLGPNIQLFQKYF